MASVVDTSTKHFTSQMSGAPVLSGTAGSLIALLDACLRDGFDIKTLSSLTVAGGVATAAYAGAHSATPDSVVLIAGVTGGPAGFADLNGEQKITTKAAAGNSVTFATALPDGVYTGTITMKMAPLGWTKVYAGANKAVYKSADPTGSGCYLRVDDSGTTVARVIGYESMTDVDSGVGPFPTPAQIAGGGYWAKSSAANGAATQWLLSGDSKVFYFTNAAALPTSSGYLGTVTRGFGDPVTQKPGGDPYACFLNCSLQSVTSSSIDGGLDRRWDGANNTTFSPRTHTGLGSAVPQFARALTGISTAASGQDTLLGIFPNECVDGAIRLSRRAIVQVGFLGIRAFVPGVHHIPQDRLAGVFNNFDKFTATDGRRFIVMLTSSSALETTASATFGAVPIDVTGPWR
ncbi:hypothetical protein J7E49_26075 [Variovorax paradoxus]|nr:hypothetical protein [Variovorax paradoxus]